MLITLAKNFTPIIHSETKVTVIDHFCPVIMKSRTLKMVYTTNSTNVPNIYICIPLKPNFDSSFAYFTFRSNGKTKGQFFKWSKVHRLANG